MSAGLYRLDEFKDNCGFGLIAHTKGKASHKLLETAIESLTCMTDRGGIAAEGKTGDGCGLLLQKPDSFLRTVAKEQGISLPEQYAVGSIMLSQDASLREQARATFAEEMSRRGLKVLGWRHVPTDNACLGEIALQSVPVFEHVFVAGESQTLEQLNASLFLAKRCIENRLKGDDAFYIASLSSSVISYKGLMMPVDLPAFYKDLADERLETAICVFHQRFSTNTMPRWPLAQPFRMLAHNGEINTITGNRNWSVARTPKCESPLLPDLSEALPLVNRTGSDSSSLDNMLEFLLAGGMPLHRAVRMLVPPAWRIDPFTPEEVASFYKFHGCFCEPWDGPAALAFTDGRTVAASLDRNGLRPARFKITEDGIFSLGSEVGTAEVTRSGTASPSRSRPPCTTVPTCCRGVTPSRLAFGSARSQANAPEPPASR